MDFIRTSLSSVSFFFPIGMARKQTELLVHLNLLLEEPIMSSPQPK